MKGLKAKQPKSLFQGPYANQIVYQKSISGTAHSDNMAASTTNLCQIIVLFHSTVLSQIPSYVSYI